MLFQILDMAITKKWIIGEMLVHHQLNVTNLL